MKSVIMKSKLSLAVIALCAAGVIGSTAALGGTATVAVSAAVVGSCKFTLTNGVVAFGDLDPASTSDATGTVTQPVFWCTKSATWNITDNDGMNDVVSGIQRMEHTSATLTEYIPYSFTYTVTGAGTGKTTPINMDIVSTVLYADFVNASEGDYADTVTLTINP